MTVGSTTIKETMAQFAKCFSNKNAEGIENLLDEEFSLFDPALKWIRGKNAVLHVLRRQFSETEHVSYEVINAYEEGNIGILEFKITLDDMTLYGVDLIEFKKGKMKELRSYYHSPSTAQK